MPVDIKLSPAEKPLTPLKFWPNFLIFKEDFTKIWRIIVWKRK